MKYIKPLGYNGIKYEADKDFDGENSINYILFDKKVLIPIK